MRPTRRWRPGGRAATARPGPADAQPGPADAQPGPAAARRVAIWSLTGSVTLMLALAISGASAVVPALPPDLPRVPLPWAGHLADVWATVLAWVMVVTGLTGTLAGLAAVRGGWRPRAGRALTAGLIAAVAFTLTAPVGSTDMLDYACYGRISALGHSPYAMTPQQLMDSHDPVGAWRPVSWRNKVSVYGPLATLAGEAASELAGPSMTRTIAWLKAWNALAFLAIALALHRLLRADAAARARAHLLWTVNPLVLFAVLAGGHIDGLAAGLGFGGLLLVRAATARTRPASVVLTTATAIAAGVLLGGAIAIKANLAIFLAGAIWHARRSPRSLAAIGGGALAVLVPGYLIAGQGAIAATYTRGVWGAVQYQPWQLITGPLSDLTGWPMVRIVAWVALAISAGLALVFGRGFPAGRPDFALARLVLVPCAAWLLITPLQRPWFDAMIFPLLAVMPAGPASGLDTVLMVRAAVATAAQLPGVTIHTLLRPHWLAVAQDLIARDLAPVVLLACLLVLLRRCRTGDWARAAAKPPPDRRARTRARIRALITRPGPPRRTRDRPGRPGAPPARSPSP